MKTPLQFPQGFFTRTLRPVLIVILFSKALILVYSLMSEDVIADHQYSHDAALAVRVFWAVDEELRAAIVKASGLRQAPSSADQPDEQHWPYMEIFQQQMQMGLGSDIKTRLRIHRPSQLWACTLSLGGGWLAVPLYPHPLRGQRIWSVLGQFPDINLLSTAAAWIFICQLNQLPKCLVAAVHQFGQRRSVHLPLGLETSSKMARVYRAFDQMAEDIEQGGRECELMLTGVSHDLYTPLTRLRLLLELLPESEWEMVENVVRDIEDMDVILDQFPVFIHDGRDESVEEGDLADLVREAVVSFNQIREQVCMALQPVSVISLRRAPMKHLLGNLINNALNHGGGSVEMASYVAGENVVPYVVLGVFDRGQGINPTEVDSIFSPFIYGDRARGGRGTGFGLAIVKRIAVQHGGSVELRNHDGGGLEARVCLPLGLLLPHGAARYPMGLCRSSGTSRPLLRLRRGARPVPASATDFPRAPRSSRKARLGSAHHARWTGGGRAAPQWRRRIRRRSALGCERLPCMGNQ